MKTKEEILDNKIGIKTGMDLKKKLTLEAMDEWAKVQDFEFAQFVSNSDWTYLPSKKLWFNEEDEERITPKTTEQLYELYVASKKIKQND